MLGRAPSYCESKKEKKSKGVELFPIYHQNKLNNLKLCVNIYDAIDYVEENVHKKNLGLM
jgi:hypothetical protein